ncbi:MAG TPA: purine-nucleoside phosphorylase [Thermoanaerobaculales bacterium]|nr:purine-nucleoside phosphorylase [Thermoanaerobaculales bacterium]HPA80725.1 purine-nucleoside phosphorylase [Thermoanaerobaculales bacterium]HQL29068.1 purine-nucleoside phosphorylase [Thermoanaerobaculales bacterium]HQN96480.1 purine-nucleoside phosphorylase [Thermoanaerobaculales bacterium]HQP43043.1 purine-nucleoside phosphorylase [Thermoanaerobaculales bacterium]
MATIHINARPGDFAGTVLMPGDPLRARHIAERFLEGARQVTDVRNMLGFTGAYRGNPVSVMAHGMGIPSAAIYCTELIRDFGVTRLIRVGSCGTVHRAVRLRDIVIAMGASTDSAVNRNRFAGHDLAALASFDLVRRAVAVAERRQLRFHVGSVFSADLFYTPDPSVFDLMERFGILGVEMETAGIYTLAAELGAEALALCTVSDLIRSGGRLTPEERQTSFDEMIALALETAFGAAR